MHEQSVRIYGAGSKFELTIPRSILDSFRSTDDPNILKLALLLECMWLEAFRYPDFLGVGGQHNIFNEVKEIILSSRYYLSSELVKRCKPGGYQEAHLKVLLMLEGYSRSCLFVKSNIVDTFDDKVLVSSMYRILLTNKATRKSVQVPRWFHDAFSKCIPHKVLPLYVVESLPPVTFCRMYQVRLHDIDLNGHANNKVYLRECLRCLAEAPLIGSLAAMRMVHRPDWLHRITCVECYNVSECFYGDSLVIHCWQQHPDLVLFHIRRQDVTVYHCKIRFALESTRQAKL